MNVILNGRPLTITTQARSLGVHFKKDTTTCPNYEKWGKIDKRLEGSKALLNSSSDCSWRKLPMVSGRAVNDELDSSNECSWRNLLIESGKAPRVGNSKRLVINAVNSPIEASNCGTPSRHTSNVSKLARPPEKRVG